MTKHRLRKRYGHARKGVWVVDTTPPGSKRKHYSKSHKTKAKADAEAIYLNNRGYGARVYFYEYKS